MADIPDAEIARRINARLEALKHIRDYSAFLVFIQSGFVAVIGSLLKTSTASVSTIYLGILLTVLIVSIYFGAVVVAGTIPYIVQYIADADKPDFKKPEKPDCNINRGAPK